MSVGLVMEIAASVAAGTVVGGWVLDTPRRSADRAKATAEEQWFQREMEESRRLEERNRQEAFIASQLEQQAQEPGLVGDEARATIGCGAPDKLRRSRLWHVTFAT